MPGRTRSALDASMTKCSKRERSAARAWAKFDACAARMEGPPRRTGRRVRVLTMAPDARSASAEMVLGPRAMIALRCTTTAQPGAKPSTLRTRSTAHASHAYTGTENTASAAAGVACPMVRESLRGSPLASGAEFFWSWGGNRRAEWAAVVALTTLLLPLCVVAASAAAAATPTSSATTTTRCLLHLTCGMAKSSSAARGTCPWDFADVSMSGGAAADDDDNMPLLEARPSPLQVSHHSQIGRLVESSDKPNDDIWCVCVCARG
mmetsp:Transcript_4797/g.19191  ORF Transcript_4797/g.19191 Transcript_4797/m.19191 type:complete len:264 (+) Transcript_4797:669-1460(+)